jgi:hypothetical protein
MNTFFSKNTVLIWAVLLLLVLNASIVGTMLYRNIRDSRIMNNPHVPMPLHLHQPAPGAFLKDELGLSDEQFLRFRESREQYQTRVREMNHRIGIVRRNYLQELMRKQPDTVHLTLTCDSIGLMHAALMKETGQYYHQIRKLCQEDQVEKLNDFFIRAVEIEADPGMHPRVGRSVPHYGRGNRGK